MIVDRTRRISATRPTVALLGAALFLFPAPAAAQIVRGPYLQDLRSGSVVVVFEGASFSMPRAEYGAKAPEEQSAPCQCEAGNCECVLSGLSADADHVYRVSDGDHALSSTGSFHTAPGWSKPFKFAVMGDNRSDAAAHGLVVDALLDGLAFLINTGDMVDWGASEEQWTEFFGIEGPLLLHTPLFAAVGNHELDGAGADAFERLFHAPFGSGSDTFYSFDYGSAHLVVLDGYVAVSPYTECGYEVEVYEDCFSPAQVAWVKADLAKAKADPSVEHVLVFMHEGPYSSKPGRTGSRAVRELLPLFAESKVRVVMSGHDHFYEHGISGNGLHYIVSGGGGAPLYAADPSGAGAYPHEVLLTRSVHNYQVVEVDGPTVRVTAYDVDGHTVLDELEVTAPSGCESADQCQGGHPGSCIGDWKCSAGSCVWVCAPPPPCNAVTDCPQPPPGACRGRMMCSSSHRCHFACDVTPDCTAPADCAGRPPLTPCDGGAFACPDGVCEWVCPGEAGAGASEQPGASGGADQPGGGVSSDTPAETVGGGCAGAPGGAAPILAFLLALGLWWRRRRWGRVS